MRVEPIGLHPYLVDVDAWAKAMRRTFTWRRDHTRAACVCLNCNDGRRLGRALTLTARAIVRLSRRR